MYERNNYALLYRELQKELPKQVFVSNLRQERIIY